MEEKTWGGGGGEGRGGEARIPASPHLPQGRRGVLHVAVFKFIFLLNH